ncbi:hypothetical protein LCGC14_1997620 [marine sediment metagenome]|uniref:Uncharacterized protein n=1 Tax=marine sediment metagenome TaxID=412755 RepID=A0A0F9HHM9_9ZZZZ
MPSLVVTGNTTAQTIAAERENAVVQLKSLTIDNQRGAGDREITIQDSFTPAAAYGATSPSAQVINRWRALVAQGDMLILGEPELKGIKCLGALLVDSDVTDAALDITVGYEHE